MNWEEMLISSFQRAPWGWGLLGTVVTGFFVYYPKVKHLTIGEHAQMRQEYIDEIKALRVENRELQKKVEALMRELAEVRVELAGYKKQHLSEQAAAIRNIPAVREAVEDVAKNYMEKQ